MTVTSIEKDDLKLIIRNWLETTTKTVKNGLKNSLQPVKNLTGLHIIREEALKIGKYKLMHNTEQK